MFLFLHFYLSKVYTNNKQSSLSLSMAVQEITDQNLHWGDILVLVGYFIVVIIVGILVGSH